MHKPVCIFFYYQRSGITSEEVGVTPVILSGTILKSSFVVNLTFEILMRKLTLKIGRIPQKSEWLASLNKDIMKKVNKQCLLDTPAQ